MKTLARPAAFGVTLTLASAALLYGAASAAAHVTVHSADATQGGYAVLTFRVPTESATASTTALTIVLPTEHPIASVLVAPHPGWSFTVKQRKLDPPITTEDGQVTEAVSEIDWKADSAATAIKPGEFDQFDVSAGPLPDVSSLTFKALQTYSDGSVVKWIETPAPGSTAEPDHPAPKLTLTAANTDTAPSGASATPAPTRAAAADTASSGTALTGIVLGAVGVALGVVALIVVLAGRRRATNAS